jgi:hypothetical protein
VATVDTNGLATAQGVGNTTIEARWLAGIWTYLAVNDSCELTTQEAIAQAFCDVAPPSVTSVTANGAIRISLDNVDGDRTITHFVTPKSNSSDKVTLTVTISPDTSQIRQLIDWEGATESPSNPLQATVPKNAAAKKVVKIKYNGMALKEFRVWIVWATITSTDIPLAFTQIQVGNPPGAGSRISSGYSFTHIIQPSEILTDDDKPNFSGVNRTVPPGENHPVSGSPLALGANKKWDNSRQVRAKKINPFGISNNDIQQPPLPNSISYPSNDVEGNDDSSTGEETNNPYADNGTLTGIDSPSEAIAHRAGVDDNTYEARYQFREFTRLEIERVWYRISDFYLWRVHIKFIKFKDSWANYNSEKALDNNNF